MEINGPTTSLWQLCWAVRTLGTLKLKEVKRQYKTAEGSAHDHSKTMQSHFKGKLLYHTSTKCSAQMVAIVPIQQQKDSKLNGKMWSFQQQHNQ